MFGFRVDHGRQEVIGIGEFLTPLDPKLRISSG
jgi:hypothetical protein